MKTQNIIKLFLGLLLLIGIMTSCEDVVDVDLEESNLNYIAVEAYISTATQNNIQVKITRTLEVDDTTSYPAVNDAVVTITDDASTPNTVALIEYYNTGIYLLPYNVGYPAKVGRTYTISITTTDGTVITGSDYLAEVPKLDSVNVNLYEILNKEYLGIFVSTQDIPDVDNYYKWNVYINDKVLVGGDNLIYSSDELFDGNYVSNASIMLDIEDDEEDKVLHKGDTVIVNQQSISEPIYQYHVGISNQVSAGSLFSVQPDNLPSNLTSQSDEKVVGSFSAYDISYGDTIVIDDSNFTLLK